MKTIVCSYCGAINKKNNATCVKCGAPLGKTRKEIQQEREYYLERARKRRENKHKEREKQQEEKKSRSPKKDQWQERDDAFMEEYYRVINMEVDKNLSRDNIEEIAKSVIKSVVIVVAIVLVFLAMVYFG